MQKNEHVQKIQQAYSFIRSKTDATPTVGVILGSGLGDFADSLEDKVRVPFSEIPEFPLSTVAGHEGAFVFGSYEGVPIVALQGRLHFYEGYTPHEVTLPVRIMKKLGVQSLILTNAAGGINLEFTEGALMIIQDHILYTGGNPLIGPNLEEFGPRFPDVSDIYTKSLRNEIKEAAKKAGINLHEGVYINCSGPNYETAAEIRFFRAIGADAVGMSTVPEALVACHAGMKIVGISCITNMATGVLEGKLDHEGVINVANRVKADFKKVLGISIKAAGRG